jgi:hypothetical protein
MTRDEIIERMGWPLNANSAISDLVDRVEAVVRKAEEAEREECARLCEETARHNEEVGCDIDLLIGNMECATAIRARGETWHCSELMNKTRCRQSVAGFLAGW